LSLMDGKQLLYGLDFDDHPVLDEKVDAITTVDPHPLVDDREVQLPDGLYVS